MQMIEIDRLAPDPNNVRVWNKDEQANNQLVASIRAIGIIQPIVVKVHPDEPERFMIVTGHRRYAAAQAAGLVQVPVAMFTGHDSTVTQLAENIVRAPMRIADVWTAVTRLLDGGWTAGDVGIAFNLSDRRITQFELMGRLPAPIVSHIRETNDVPPDSHLRRLVYGDQAKLAAAFKSAKTNYPGEMPWGSLAVAAAIHRIDLAHACWEITAEDRVAFDVRDDFFEQAGHPGFAYNVSLFFERQVNEIEARLAEWRKKGFQTILVRSDNETSAAQTKKLAYCETRYDQLARVAKAKREDLVVIAILGPAGSLQWQVMKKKAEKAKSEQTTTSAAVEEPSNVTKAAEPKLDWSKRNALAAHLADEMRSTGELLAAACLMLHSRLGWPPVPEVMFDDNGELELEHSKVRDVAKVVLHEAAMASVIDPKVIDRLGTALVVHPTLLLTKDELDMLKKPAIEGIFKARGIAVPDGTLKAQRQMLYKLLNGEGPDGIVTLYDSDLPALRYASHGPLLGRLSGSNDDDPDDDDPDDEALEEGEAA